MLSESCKIIFIVYVSKKLAAINNSKAISGSMLNSGILSEVVFVYFSLK